MDDGTFMSLYYRTENSKAIIGGIN